MASGLWWIFAEHHDYSFPPEPRSLPPSRPFWFNPLEDKNRPYSWCHGKLYSCIRPLPRSVHVTGEVRPPFRLPVIPLECQEHGPGSDTLVLALLHKFPLQKVQINLSLTGSLTHSVTTVNGWRSRLMCPSGRGPHTHLNLSRSWLAAQIWTFELFCVFPLPSLVITPQLAPLFCARRRFLRRIAAS